MRGSVPAVPPTRLSAGRRHVDHESCRAPTPSLTADPPGTHDRTTVDQSAEGDPFDFRTHPSVYRASWMVWRGVGLDADGRDRRIYPPSSPRGARVDCPGQWRLSLVLYVSLCSRRRKSTTSAGGRDAAEAPPG